MQITLQQISTNIQIKQNPKNNRYPITPGILQQMKQPNQDNRIRKKQQSPPQTNLQMRPKQSNYSVGSEVSFNGESKKPKSKSFNRKQSPQNQEQSSIVTIYRQLQYTPEIRNALKKFCYLDKDKLLKLSVNQLRQLCEKQLKRIDILRKNSVHIQRLLSEQEIDETDNELSLIAISTQVNALVEFRNELRLSQGVSNDTTAKTRLRQYETILLQIEKSDQLIKNFINTHLKLPQPSDISIPDCKRFFKKQAFTMSQSSDRLVLSRKTLCQIIIFLCRLLQGQILAFDDIYEYQDESFNSIEFGDDYNKYVVQSRTVRNNQVIVQNLDQSFQDNGSQQSRNSLNGHANGASKKGNTYQSYSNDDLGKKVRELAGICEQIPQLEAFTRTLKFSKITLQNRQSFFRIVDVIIALHHKIGYLSRNKPTLLRQIQHIESDLTEVYQTLREFVLLLTSDVPQFGELRFKNEEDAKHQLTEIISYLKKDMRKLAEIIRDQNDTQKGMYQRIQLLRSIIQTFCQSLGQSDQSIWQQYTSKLLNNKPIHQQQRQIINWLSQFYTTVFTQLRSGMKNQQDLETEKNLQAEVHTLLTDYERLRAQHQQLQGKYNILLEQKDQLVFDIEQRDKIIGNLTSIKISSQKREKSLRDQLLQAQDDASRFQHDLGLLEEQLEIMSIQNQNKINDMVYEHQTEVKQLVDKITILQRAKMELLGKYQDQCSKSIRLLQDGNYSSVEMQTLKDRLQKKIKQHDENNRKQKEQINGLEKQLQQAKNDKSLLENKLQLAEKNKNKLMDRLEEVNNKYNSTVKGFEDKYQEEIIAIKEAHYKMEKELEKYKRNNALLQQQLQQLKQQNAAQAKSNNQYRMKLIQFNSVQTEYDSLVKQYDRVVDSFHKLQTNNQTLKQKLFELTGKQQEILELLAREKQLNRKLEKKCKDQDVKLEEIINSYEGNDLELKEQQKINKMLQKKISELQTQIQGLQQSLQNKDKSHSMNINKSEMKYRQLNGQLQQEVNRLKQTIEQLQGHNNKLLNDTKIQQKQHKQLINDHQHKQLDWQHQQKELLKGKTLLQKKLSQSEEERKELQQKIRLLQQQAYNQSILIQQIKQEKHLYELRINELQAEQKTELTQLRKGIQGMQEIQNSLKQKIKKLQSEVQKLCGQIEELKLIIKQKDREIEQTHEQTSRKFKAKQAQQQEKRLNQYQSKKTQEITQLRQQILIEKNIIITENKKLHDENTTLQEEIAKLRALNQSLEKNINKLSATSSQHQEELAKEENNFKMTLNKHLYTIGSLENQLTSVNAERETLKRDYDELQAKLQAKSKALAEKDNLLFQRDLQKNNLEKIVKQLKFKISQLEATIEGLTASVDKMKNNKIRGLEQELTQLNGLLQEWKKKDELSRFTINDLQQEIQKLKRDNAKRIQSLKEEHLQIEEQYQSQIRKIQSQHSIDLSTLEHKTRKDTENEFNQLLIKQKEIFNNLTIQKMEELGEMQRKYEKLIRDERNDRNILQQECNRLQRELNELKRNKSLNDSKILQEETDNNIIEELQRVKSQYELLKRQQSRIQQENSRLLSENTHYRQENSTLQGKCIELEHSITILTSKLNLVTQNLQTTKKSIQQLHKLQLDKLNLQRELQKLKAKSISDDSRINDYKQRLQEMEHKINDLQGKLQQWRVKQFQWTRCQDESTERFRVLNSQSTDMSLKLQQMKQKLQEMTNKLTEKTHKLQSVQTQLQVTQQKVKQKQIEFTKTKQHLQGQIYLLQQQLTKKSNTNIMLEREKKQLLIQWQAKENQIREQAQLKARRVRQLEMQLGEYKRNANEGNKMIEELTKVRSQKLELEGRCNRLEIDVGKYQGEKVSMQRQNELLGKELTNSNNQRSRLGNQLRNLQHQLKLLQSQNQQLSMENQHLIQEIHKVKDFSTGEVKNLREQLISEFNHQRQTIENHYEEIIKQINGQLSKERQKYAELLNKYNQLVQDLEQAQKLIDTLRKENMRLSDHCQKYQARIQVLQQRVHGLETDHHLKGQSALEIQNKYHLVESERHKLGGENLQLKGELERVNRENAGLRQRISELEKELENSVNNNKLLQQRVTALNGENDRKAGELRNLQQTSLGSNLQLQRLRAQILRLNTQISQKTHQLNTLQSSSTGAQQKLTDTKDQLQWMRNQNNILVDKINKAQKQLQLLAKQFGLLQQRLHEAEGYIHWSDNERKGLEERLRLIGADLQKCQLQNQQLKQRLNASISQLEKFQLQNKTLKNTLFQLQGDKNKQQYEQKSLTNQNSDLKKRIQQLQTHLKTLQSQHRQNQINKSSQQSAEIHRLMAQLALTRQELLRVNELIKTKEIDFNREMQRLLDEKNRIWQENQLLAQQCQSMKTRLDEMERLNQLKGKEIEDMKQERLRNLNEIDQLRRKSGQIAKLQSQLAVTRMQYSRLHAQHSKLTQQLAKVNDLLHQSNIQSQRLHQQLNKQRHQSQHLIRELHSKDQTLSQITKQLEIVSKQSTTTNHMSSSMKQDLDKAYQQLNHLRSVISRLEGENHNMNTHLLAKDKIINQMKDNVNKGNQLMENADKELKKSFEQRTKQSELIKQLTQQKDHFLNTIKQLTQQRDSYLQIIKMRQSQTVTLKETITILERRITEMTHQIHVLSSSVNEHSQQLNQSRSNINLVTKSYSYQGGQVTSQQLARLQEQNRRLIKEIQARDKTISLQLLEIQKLTKQIKILKQQIHLLQSGKTINIKGYTRVTNPNDTTLNTKGIIYTEYDVKQMKAKIQLLEKSLSRYQDRETQLLREIEKYKFRQRHYTEQIRVLEENAKVNKLKQPDSVKQIPITSSPQKKTSFDEDYNNRQNQPKSSTYKLQTGIQVTQRTINMTKKQVKTTEKYFLRIQGQQLRKIIQRLTNGQHIINSKIDQILTTTQKTNKQSLQLVLTNNQFNLTPVIINQIRQLIHQNKALVETLKSMKQFKQDVGLLIQEYIDPELLTEFVYRILTYFSEVSDQSSEAKEIRNQLNLIRKNNVGGFYFTVLEEYTKYILENNSIEIYKEELRQKARELISFREKFQAIIDSKLDENQKLLNRSDSKNSFLNRSRTKYMGSSRMGSSRGKSQCSEFSREDNSRVKEIVPASNVSNNNGTRISLPVGQPNILPNPIHLLTGAGNTNIYNNPNQQQNYIPTNIMLSPSLITAERPRTSSTLTYTPYNKQLISQSNTPPSQSVNESRVHVSYSTTSTSHMANSFTTINNSNQVNFMKPPLDKKL